MHKSSSSPLSSYFFDYLIYIYIFHCFLRLLSSLLGSALRFVLALSVLCLVFMVYLGKNMRAHTGFNYTWYILVHAYTCAYIHQNTYNTHILRAYMRRRTRFRTYQVRSYYTHMRTYCRNMRNHARFSLFLTKIR